MTSETLTESAHPAPERHKVRAWPLWLALTAPPLAWSLQSIVGYAISTRACFPGDSLRAVPTFVAMPELLLAINGVALLICVVGAVVSYRNWSVTRHERGGDSTHLIDRGEGRTRFLAMLGLLNGGGFLVATLFTSISLLLSPVCR